MAAGDTTGEAAFMTLVRAIVDGDWAALSRLLVTSPELAVARAQQGATRQSARDFYLAPIQHYLYAGDTALHVAAAAYRPAMIRELLAAGAEVDARNRRGAQPLHYAADGNPNSSRWNPRAQAETIAVLIDAGADPNATDKSGVTPLHRAVRTRCAAGVAALLAGGGDPGRANGRGSTAVHLATRATGRGGAGSPAAKAQQAEILRILAAAD